MRNGITVRDVMNREFVGVSESDGLVEAAELMRSEPTEAVVVVRGSEPIGSLSTATALAAMLDGDPGDRTVGDVMEPPVPTISPDASLADGTRQLIARGTTHLLVVDDDEIVGLLTERDVLAATETAEAPTTATAAAGTGATEAAEGGAEIDAEGATEESVQGICEGCGSLTPELSTVNGQLVCPDCRAY
ncbi:MAG: CBS domain-containing protein [Euryarchaeota archaeon]|nr:CBS domain-containing protein [Euryarchaeota archaeon]